MIIAPPELTTYSSSRYQHDLNYRQEIDNERIGERHLRLLLLFNQELTYEIDY